ncbi:MAG TPA: GNAT family N-acetyltransferase [Caulobacteraceae bacterium]|nr:GNAT family N-acetyltransferase [Caulobacteraceae bacterium]
MTAPLLETSRLSLRPLEEADFDLLWAIWSEPPVREHLITLPRSLEDFRPVFDNMHSSGESLAMWTVRLRDGAVIGRCGFYEFGEDRTPELAFLLSESAWGRGLATEAATAALAYGFGVRRWPRVVALTRPENLRSKRVLEKLGLENLKAISIRNTPVDLFSIQREAWSQTP